MPVHFDLQKTYASELDQRGIGADTRKTYMELLQNVAEYVGTSDPARWNRETLEAFMMQRLQGLDGPRRAIYSTGLAILTEVLDHLHSSRLGADTRQFEVVHAGAGKTSRTTRPGADEQPRERSAGPFEPRLPGGGTVAGMARPAASVNVAWDAGTRRFDVVALGEVVTEELDAALEQIRERDGEPVTGCLLNLMDATPLESNAAKSLSDWLIDVQSRRLCCVAVVSPSHIISRVEVTAARSQAVMHAEETGVQSVAVAFFEDVVQARRWMSEHGC